MAIQDSDRQYLQAIGARVLSEANDLKRTPEALAGELGISLERITSVIAGEEEREKAEAVLQAMARVYPVSIADLWVEYDDTDHGVRIVSAADSLATQRIIDRRDRTGGLSPYYEYRDTAMSRTAPFKPEWIKELRVVDDSGADNPDVAYNNGHLMHQTTLFVGPVNFYWEINEQRHCVEMDTGDSNYITPFVPHSFASRDPNNLGLIIAVTYGAEVRQALTDLGRLGGGAFESLVADPRRPDEAFIKLLARQAAAESLSTAQLIERLVNAGFDSGRAHTVVTDGGPTVEEIEVIAAALNVRPTDLTVSPLTQDDPVVVQRRSQSVRRSYPDAAEPAYELAELARTRHQPLLKGFDLSVVGSGNGDMQHSLHEYVFNYGDSPVTLVWGEGRQTCFGPGDSAYVQPMVRHRFDRIDEADAGRLAVIRIPGALTGSVINELSTYAPEGRARVTGEMQRWF